MIVILYGMKEWCRGKIKVAKKFDGFNFLTKQVKKNHVQMYLRSMKRKEVLFKNRT